MTSWLSKQKKQTLLELSNEAGLKQSDDTRKDELIENLDHHLQANATRLSKTAAFEPYYGTRRTPSKARSSSAAAATSDDGEVKSVVKARGRRTTKVKQEIEDAAAGESTSPVQKIVSASKAMVSRTPGRPRSRSQLPASPADVANEIELATKRAYEGIDNLYTRSSIPDTIDRIREMCSSVVGVQLTFLFLEALALQRELVPWIFIGPRQRMNILGQTTEVGLPIPNVFALLEAEFWTTSLLWASTSIFTPMLFGYFYNLSIRDVKRSGNRVTVARYRVDPLTFSIVKALATVIVYQRHYTFGGLIDASPRAKVETTMFGGYRGLLFGSYVGVITALYEAAQRH